MPNSTARFVLSYDGEALQEGVMDVRELAPALLSMGSLCERANYVLNGERARVSCQVRSDFRSGSFNVELQLALGLMNSVRGLFDGESISGANQILKFLGIGGVAGLIQLLRKMRGNKPERVEEASDGVRITQGNVSVVVNANTYNLYRDSEARRHVEGVVRPLQRGGVESLEFSAGEFENITVRERITRDEADYFRAPPESDLQEELVPETEGDYAFQIAAVPLREGLKWRLENDSMRITAAMADQGFVARMRDGEESFRVGDILVVRLRTRSYADSEGCVHSEHTIVEVKRHRRRASQLGLG